MGGSAFTQLVQGSFPRLPPAVYSAIKTRFLPLISNLYVEAAVPREAPEKATYGDLDILVYGEDIPHAQIQRVLGAQHVIPMPENRTSNYAVPISIDEWEPYGHLQDEQQAREEASELFYQVDIHVCKDKDEWDRILFFHGYGDLGMMLGLLARNNGLQLGAKGLRVPDAPFPPFHLSDDMTAILDFMGLSMGTWKAGFKTRRAIYDWYTSSPLFDPNAFNTDLTRVKSSRGMYHEFLDHVRTHYPRSGSDPLVDKRQAALVHFGLSDEYRERIRSREARARLKVVFNGHRVSEWTGLGTNWRAVAQVMREVRAQHGGEEGVSEFLYEHGQEALEKQVAEALSRLQL